MSRPYECRKCGTKFNRQEEGRWAEGLRRLVKEGVLGSKKEQL